MATCWEHINYQFRSNRKLSISIESVIRFSADRKYIKHSMDIKVPKIILQKDITTSLQIFNLVSEKRVPEEWSECPFYIVNSVYSFKKNWNSSELS